ncbi:MAG: hypothetical protein KatS3mg123_2347 [Burkholderiales bacterium]|nr:MAG: hypothetical protein KatS3mg123_2347 [Burkholderiales bacterium]
MIYALGDRRVEIRGNDYFVADNATVIGSVVIGHNASIWFNCVVRGDNDVITIGDNCNIQDASVLHTDEGVQLTLERNVSVGHMVMLHGCYIGEGSLIGIKAVVLNGARVGKELPNRRQHPHPGRQGNPRWLAGGGLSGESDPPAHARGDPENQRDRRPLRGKLQALQGRLAARSALSGLSLVRPIQAYSAKDSP